jgi:hypothetical protein
MTRTYCRSRLQKSLFFGAVVCGSLSPVQASWSATRVYVTYITESRADCDPCTYNIWLQDGNFREEVAAKKEADDSALFVNDELIFLRGKQHIYSLVNRPILEMVSPDRARLRHKLEAQTSSLNAAQRTQLTKYLNKVSPAADSEADDIVRDTGQTEVIAAQTYAVWERRPRGRKLAEFLVLPHEKVPGASEWQRVIQGLDRMTAGLEPAMGGEFEHLFGRVKDLARVQGVPIYTRQFNPDGSLHSEVRLQFSSVKAMPAKWLQIPVGYRPDPAQPHLTPN